MRKTIFSTISIMGLLLMMSGPVFAQGMMGSTTVVSDGHTAREEAEGRVVWEKIQAKQSACTDVSDDDFGALGEYFMGQMMWSSHEAMNVMMERMMGKEGEEQMHVVLGKRLSGCDTSAAFPSQGAGFMPMMNMMTGGWSSPFGMNQTNNSMMSFGFMPFGWIFMILWWALIIAGIVALLTWLGGQSRSSRGHGKSALDILKERYARGEINKQEFEKKKKDLA